MEPSEIPGFTLPPGSEWKTVGSGKKSEKSSDLPKKNTAEPKRGFREMRDEIDPQIRAEWEE